MDQDWKVKISVSFFCGMVVAYNSKYRDSTNLIMANQQRYVMEEETMKEVKVIIWGLGAMGSEIGRAHV